MKRLVAIAAALTTVGISGSALASQHGFRSELQNVQNLASSVAHKAAFVSARSRPNDFRRARFQSPLMTALRNVRFTALTLASRTFHATTGVLSSDLAVVRARYREARSFIAAASLRPGVRAEFESIRADLRAIKAAITRMRAFEVRHLHTTAPAPIVPRVVYAPAPIPQPPAPPAPTSVYSAPGVNVSWYQSR